MDQIKIARINELARKSREPGGLTDQERAEQAALRREYVDGTYVVDEQGREHKLKKKGE